MQSHKNQTIESDFMVRDNKENAARVNWLSLITIVVSLTIAVTVAFNGNVKTAFIVSGETGLSLITVLLVNLGYYKVSKYYFLFQINIFLVFVSFMIGLRAGGHIYFFPLLFALPLMVDNYKINVVEIPLFLGVTIACFTLSVFFGRENSAIENISDAIYNIVFHLNCVLAILISALFAYLGIYFERQHVKLIMAEKEKVDEAMQARIRFLSTMGHELRTPLNGIIGVSTLLQKEAMLPAQKEYFDVLKYCSDHMLSLVNDILDFNKIEAGKFELHPIAINLKDFLVTSAMPFYNRFKEKGIKLEVVVDDKLNEHILVDDIKLTQIINNLVSNALKFTIEGKVTIRATCFGNDNGKLTACFEVEDTGIGMQKEDAAKIFAGFWQIYHESSRKYQGTGLGLTITQRLLNLMGTELEVKSDYGVGSTFYFTLTFPIAQFDADRADADTPEGDLTGYRLLVADDNPINMLVASKTLLGWNATLTACKSGQEVLDALAADHEYNMILLDLEMPDVDGYTAAREIKKLYPGIPMMAFTAALVDNKLYDDLLAIGFSDCILKPFQPGELFAKIKQHIN